jgi:hypothetical protein
MKSLITLLTLTASACIAQAQITINRSDFGQFGDQLYYANDTTLTNFTLGAAGENITWDFSTMVTPNLYESSSFFDPSTFEGAPGEANMGILQDETPTFFNISDTSVKVIVPMDFLGGDNSQITIVRFPFTYGSPNLKDSVTTKMQGTPEDFGYSGVPFDSMRINVKIISTSMVDGWGTVITPAQSYDALRVKNVTKADITIEGKVPFLGWTPIPFDGLNQDQAVYAWYAKGSKFSVAEAALDTLGNPVSFRYQVAEVPTGLGLLSSSATKTIATPNPANQNISLQFNSTAKGNAHIEIIDITGKVVFSKQTQIVTGNNSIDVNTELFNNGLYFAKITGTNLAATSKFVVQH